MYGSGFFFGRSSLIRSHELLWLSRQSPIRLTCAVVLICAAACVGRGAQNVGDANKAAQPCPPRLMTLRAARRLH
jgi:hypothetical protein